MLFFIKKQKRLITLCVVLIILIVAAFALSRRYDKDANRYHDMLKISSEIQEYYNEYHVPPTLDSWQILNGQTNGTMQILISNKSYIIIDWGNNNADGKKYSDNVIFLLRSYGHDDAIWGSLSINPSVRNNYENK